MCYQLLSLAMVVVVARGVAVGHWSMWVAELLVQLLHEVLCGVDAWQPPMRAKHLLIVHVEAPPPDRTTVLHPWALGATGSGLRWSGWLDPYHLCCPPPILGLTYCCCLMWSHYCVVVAAGHVVATWVCASTDEGVLSESTTRLYAGVGNGDATLRHCYPPLRLLIKTSLIDLTFSTHNFSVQLQKFLYLHFSIYIDMSWNCHL
jgi:hypothetical protein